MTARANFVFAAMFCWCLDAGASTSPPNLAGSWAYKGGDASLTVHLMDNGECLVSGSLARKLGTMQSAQCVYRVEGARVTLMWTGAAAQRGLESIELVLSSDAMVMHLEGERDRVLRSTRAAPVTVIPKDRRLSDWELRARWETFFACEGVQVDSLRLTPRETRLEIEITSPAALEGSKVYIDAGNGAVRWEHSRNAGCRTGIDLEPV